jgi:hypothetical protein
MVLGAVQDPTQPPPVVPVFSVVQDPTQQPPVVPVCNVVQDPTQPPAVPGLNLVQDPSYGSPGAVLGTEQYRSALSTAPSQNTMQPPAGDADCCADGAGCCQLSSDAGCCKEESPLC